MSYKLGDKYKKDFDYCGMLKKGSKATIKIGISKLNKLYNSYEDVNYHSESESLYNAIVDLKRKQVPSAKIELEQFRARSLNTYRKICKR